MPLAPIVVDGCTGAETVRFTNPLRGEPGGSQGTCLER